MATENSGNLKSWTVTLIEDGEDLIMPLPPEALAELGWQPGDTLEWIDNGDQTWILERKNPPLVNEVC